MKIGGWAGGRVHDADDWMVDQAGDVIFTDVDRRGGGVVEFASRSDQETAISKLVSPLPCSFRR